MRLSAKWRFAVISFCVGMIVLHLIFFWLVRGEAVAGSCDFSIFYTAGRMIRAGESPILYNDIAQLRVQEEFVGKAFIRKGPLPYNHPPFEALVYVPITYMPYAYAYVFMLFLNLAAIGVAVYSIWPWLPNIRGRFPRLLLLLPLAFFPVWYALMQGQDSIFLLVLYCLSYAQFRHKREITAGLLLGLGLFKFHLVLPFAFILLLCGYWRTLSGIAISACVEFAISLKIVGWKELLYYPRYLLDMNRQLHRGVVLPENMPNLRGLLTGWSAQNPPRWMGVLVIGLSAAVLFLAARRWRHHGVNEIRTWNLGFSLALLATFLCGYHSYTYDMSFLLLPMFLVIECMIDPNAPNAKYLYLPLSLMFFSPLQLELMLNCSHQNVFALVIVGFGACLSVSFGGERIEGWQPLVQHRAVS